jgi:hypothetical protein
MMWLVLVPIIDIVIIVIAVAISVAVRSEPGPSSDISPRVTPDNPPTPVETYTTQRENPDIADQFDGRLTNIVKNPMKGIL